MDGDAVDAAEQELARSNRPRKGRRSLPWHREPIVLARMARVQRLHLAGRNNCEIAAQLDVDEVTIRRDLLRLREQWLAHIGQEAETLRAEIVAELEDTRQRAVAAAEFDEEAERAVLYGRDAEGAHVFVQRDAKDSAQFRGQKAAALNVARQTSMDKAKVMGVIVDKAEVQASVNVRRYIGVDVDAV